MNKTAPRAGRNNHRAKPNLSFRAQNYKKNDESRHKNYVFLLFVAKNGKMIIPSTHPAMPPEAPENRHSPASMALTGVQLMLRVTMMVVGDAHRPITASTPSDNDIHIGRSAWAMMAAGVVLCSRSPSPALPKGREFLPAVFEAV